MFKKTNLETTYTCSHTLSNFFQISRTSSEKIIHQYQLHLATMSCKFIQTIAMSLNINKENNPSIEHSISSDDDGRMVYPCFFSSRLLFMHMQKTKCPVLIILETIMDNDSRKDLILYDQETTQGRLLTEHNNFIEHKSNVCMVILCPRINTIHLIPLELLNKLNNYGLHTLFLANMAAHPQLSGLKLAPFSEQFVPDTSKLTVTEKKIEKEFLIFKEKAYKYGFCKENPSLLWTKHAFIDTIYNQIILHQNTKNDLSVREPVDI